MDDQSVAVVEVKGSVAQSSPYAPENFAELWNVGKLLYQSGYFKSVADVSQACVKIMAGREMGFSPIASLMHTYFINGKLAYEGVLLASAAKRRGYTFTPVRWTGDICEIRFSGPGLGDGAVTSFSMEEAKAAGLATKDNWRKHPKMMLWWRCISQGVRAFCPDVFGAGPAGYTPDELGADTDEQGRPLVVERVEVRVAQAEESVKKKFERKKKEVQEKKEEKIAQPNDNSEAPEVWAHSIEGGQYAGRTVGDLRMSGELSPLLSFDGFSEADRAAVIGAMNLVEAEAR